MSGCGDRVPGWICEEEMEFVAEQMISFGPTGKILEIGSATGRLFDYLYEQLPNWEYTAVDPWKEDVRLQLDWNIGYTEAKAKGKLGEVITKQMFETNCPFAQAHQEYFEDFETDERYDVISVGCISDKINYSEIYSKAKQFLEPNGVIVARDLQQKKHNAMHNIQQAFVDNALRVGKTKLNSCVVKKYPTMPWGTYNIDIDLNYHLQQSNDMLDDKEECKFTGHNNLNMFSKILESDKQILTKYLNAKFNERFDWHFEYFRAGEPAGLHTDYEIVPWDHWGEKIHCHTIVGIIIPLYWNCKQPYTINYNRSSSVPRKLMYRKGELRYTDTNEIYSYRDKCEYDDASLKYNPKGTEYYKEYADLKVESVYEWNIGTMMLFDTSRWHSSSWFLKVDAPPKKVSSYKQSIIGFGSVDVFSN